jgi:hypothetical protein
MDASNLIVRETKPVRFPSLAAGLWFGMFGTAAALAWVGFGMALGHGMIWGAPASQLLPYIAAAGLAAALSGFLLGGRILNPRISPGYAVLHGIGIVAIAHLLLGFMMSLMVPGPLGFNVGAAFALAAISALVGGIITFPVGGFAGYYLSKSYRKQMRPIGCKLHGYREDEVLLIDTD